MAALLCFALFAAGCRRPVPNLDSPGTSIVCFGDSISAGVGASPGQGFCEVLADRLGVEVVNEGISGNTTAEGLARLDQVLAHEPWLVIVELGGNDILRQVPISSTEATLRTIVERVLAARALPLLVEVEGPFSGDHGAIYRRLGDRYRIPVVENVLPEIERNPRLKSDEVHPNDAGHAKLAAAVAAMVKPLLEEHRRRIGGLRS
jgi:acyl-CoA thioesterase-1